MIKRLMRLFSRTVEPGPRSKTAWTAMVVGLVAFFGGVVLLASLAIRTALPEARVVRDARSMRKDAGVPDAEGVTDYAGGETDSEMGFSLLASRKIDVVELLSRFPLDDDRQFMRVMESVSGKSAVAVEELLRNWDSEGTKFRARFARETLVSWGKPADSIDAIREAMSDADERVRKSGCRRLGDMGEQAIAARAELEACLQDSDPWVRDHAIEAAEKARVVAVLPLIKECMRPVVFDEYAGLAVSTAAAKAVAMLDSTDTECVSVLNEISFKCDEELLPHILIALEAIGPRAIHARKGLARLSVLGQPSSMQTFRVERVIRSMDSGACVLLEDWLSGDHGAELLRRRSLEYLADVRRERGMYTPLYAPVAKCLSLDNEEVRSLAIRALINIDLMDKQNLATVDELQQIATFVTGESEELRIGAAEFLGTGGDNNSLIAVPALRKLASDKSPRVRAAVADSLSKYRNNSVERSEVRAIVFGVLDELVNSTDEFDRDAHIYRTRAGCLALDVLKELAPLTEAELPKLYASMQSRFADAATEAVVQVGKPAVPLLLSGLNDEDSYLRGRCADALGLIGDPSAIMPLVDLLSDEAYSSLREGVRVNAIQALSRMPEDCEWLIPKFIELLDEDWARDHATAALGALGARANAALPVLIKQPATKLGNDDSYSRDVKDIPPSAAINAHAIAQIAKGTEQELAGIRKVLSAIGSEYSWRYECIDNENEGYAKTVDLIVELGERAAPLIPELRFLLDEHELLNPVYRFEAAFALRMLQPKEPKWRKRFDELAEHLDNSFRGYIVEKRVEQLKEATSGK